VKPAMGCGIRDKEGIGVRQKGEGFGPDDDGVDGGGPE